MKTVKIKGKDYVMVKDRINFLSETSDYEIDSDYELIESEKGKMFIVKATLTIYTEKGKREYVGLAQEIVGQGNINLTSSLENAQTSAVGRACAMAGIGVIESIASADEMTKQRVRKML